MSFLNDIDTKIDPCSLTSSLKTPEIIGTKLIWLKKYSMEVLIELKNIGKKGRRPRLRNSEVSKLKEAINEANKHDNCEKYTNGKMISGLIYKKFYKVFSNGGLYNFINRIGLRKFKPRPVHEKNNPELIWNGKKNFLKK